jgi:FkbM family methyltransferase
MNFHSQWKQDKYLHENVFKGQRNGIFVDIGAHDGITGSNSFFFEKELDWTGICIEPITDRYNDLVKNRKCITENCCVYSRNCEVDFCEHKGYTEMLSGIRDTYDPRHVKRYTIEQHIMGGSTKIVKKAAYTLSYLLDKHNMHKIDFLSIDVEGAELDILKGIDFDKNKIRVIDVEDNYADTFWKIDEFLRSKGFKQLCVLSGDKVYINENYPI